MNIELHYIVSLLLLPAVFHCQSSVDSTYSNLSEDSITTTITRLNINSAQSDFSPFVVKGSLMFVSGRNRHTGVQYVDQNNNAEITDLYSAGKIDQTHFTHAKPLQSINTNYYEGSFSINKEGKVMYYTATDPESSLLKIYKTNKAKDTWSKPEILPFCKAEFSYCHPALSPDGSFMIFSSDLNKEKRGMDLYRSDYTNGSWQEPIALSDSINTTANEVFPFISGDNCLYFSSNKKGNFGGLDLYKVDLNPETMNVIHLDHPINSSSDDFGIWTDSAGTSGYFSSDRKKGSKDDIYYFNRTIPDFSNAKTVSSKTSHCYSFVEEKTYATKDTSNLSYEWDFGDGSKGRGLRTRHCYTKPGKYAVRLIVLDKVSGEIFRNETSYELNIEKTDMLEILCSDSCYTGETFFSNSGESFLKGKDIVETHWSYGDNRYSKGGSVKHIYRNPGKYKLEMGIVAREPNSDKLVYYKTQKQIVVLSKTQNEK